MKSNVAIAQVDAFTDVPFGGNPAAVVLVPPGTVVEDQLKQQIAAEMNLSETAYVEPLTDAGEPYATGGAAQAAFKTAQRYRLRWFTPTSEVALCGHATVASASALLQGAASQGLPLFCAFMLYVRAAHDGTMPTSINPVPNAHAQARETQRTRCCSTRSTAAS